MDMIAVRIHLITGLQYERWKHKKFFSHYGEHSPLTDYVWHWYLIGHRIQIYIGIDL
jgi:hypothetical protein